MDLSIEDAGRPCLKCAQPLKFFTLRRTPEYLPPITVIGCPVCGVVTWAWGDDKVARVEELTTA